MVWRLGFFVGRVVYFVFIGGVGFFVVESVKRVVDVYWFDEFGILEVVWVFEVEDFLFFVVIDFRGNFFYC